MAESYDLLSDFERDLRDFIHDVMFEVFGTGWEKSRLPSGMYGKWAEKRQKARASGESSERLIDYADFTDYVSIISQNNNWNEVFRSQFGRLQFVQESLYRLQPVRVCTMHSRILTREMWLILQTETMLLSERMWN
nr:Swt1 family HEPN domain-containing protein [Nitrospira moscoviensis]